MVKPRVGWIRENLIHCARGADMSDNMDILPSRVLFEDQSGLQSRTLGLAKDRRLGLLPQNFLLEHLKLYCGGTR